MSDDLTLTVHGQSLAGWTDVRVTRRIEGLPNDFEIGMTERFPGQVDAFVVQCFDPCTISIGPDTTITGYVDKVSRSYDPGSHTITVSGRGKCQDITDCMAEWPSGQISGSNALQIAQKLAQPYGITVTCIGDPGPTIPQFNLTIGETAFDVIEKITRYAGLLTYEDTDGNLVLATTQDTAAASGFAEGQNVQAAHVLNAGDQRFSKYLVFKMGIDVLGDVGEGGNLSFTATDPNVPRHRLTGLVMEASEGGLDITEKRAVWECARRIARGNQATIICDSWRDGAGALWAPNTKAPISLPGLKLDGVKWTISEVEYQRAEKTGTTCQVTLADPAAFTPEPLLLQPEHLDVAPANAS